MDSQRRAGGEMVFWFIFGQSLYIFGNISEVIASNLPAKLFWESFQWVVGNISIVAFPFFTIQFGIGA